MSFGVSGSKSNSKESATKDFTQTTKADVPDWLLGPSQDYVGMVSDLSKTDPSTLVPGADSLQTQASTGAANLGAGSDKLTALMNLQTQGAPQITAASLLDNLTAYQSPYKQQVVDSTLNDFDANAGKTRAAQTLAMAGQGAFGGSGAALTRSQTEGELARGRASAESTLLDQMFNTGASLSNEDAGRRQSAATTNADLKMQNRQQIANEATALDANNRANVGAQEAVGTTNRGIATEQAQAPFDFAAWLKDALGYDPSTFTGQTTTGSEKSTGKTSGTSLGVQASVKKG